MSEDSAVDRVQRLVEERYGLACTGWQRQRIAELLGSTAARSCAEPSAEQLRMLAEQLTVGESYFFREPGQIDALVDIALPELCAGSARPIRILSAGCASGEEAHSLAIALEERAPDIAGWIQIHGVDINSHAIQIARRARYSSWALRATPEPLRDRWFAAAGHDYQLRLDTRVSVTFEERNLLEDSPDFWAPQAFDVIFCRNVLMHFSDRSISAVLTRFIHVLAPGAFLFLGHSEILRKLPDHFDLLHTQDAFYQRRKASKQTAHTGSEPDAASGSCSHAGGDTPRPIARRTLAACRPAPQDLAGDAPARSSPPIEKVLTLIDAERFEDALGALATMTSRASADPYLDFLTAVILSAQGRLAGAERCCERLQGATGFEAAAHYLLGLCQEQKNRSEHARRHYQRALHLDPSFAMPHLRLGLLDRSAGHRAGAQRHLRRALDRFYREQPERIRLLGGGFPREALLDLCRAHLSALGK